MNMQEFYSLYNLNKYEFGKLINVGSKTLKKYADGITIRESSRYRIERGIALVVKHDLVRPKYNYGKALGGLGSFTYQMDFRRAVREYEERFRKIVAEEMGEIE